MVRGVGGVECHRGATAVCSNSNLAAAWNLSTNQEQTKHINQFICDWSVATILNFNLSIALHYDSSGNTFIYKISASRFDSR